MSLFERNPLEAHMVSSSINELKSKNKEASPAEDLKQKLIAFVATPIDALDYLERKEEFVSAIGELKISKDKVLEIIDKELSSMATHDVIKKETKDLAVKTLEKSNFS